MHQNILWEGKKNESLEYCLINTVPEGFEINSVVFGKSEGNVFEYEYQIKLSPKWITMSFLINNLLCNDEPFSMISDGKGKWRINGEQLNEYSGCMDIDISLSPFTNSLPINRLKIDNAADKEINALYIDILNRRISLVHQRYTRIGHFRYLYENLNNNYQAYLHVDDSGIIIDYPEEFRRKHHIIFNKK
ncbi:MAG: putative glycolipid-binding domain-containing protein [Bacteroidales bacterium]|jgi:hypothetical protein|nr:putative glycolipid-binding domain-containing protein [Bacteroidales bacterium]